MAEAKKLVPKRRFKGFTDGWEQRKLSDLAIDLVAGGDIKKELIKTTGKYPVIANALTNEGVVGCYDDNYRIKAPAVTITGRGNVGHAMARKVHFTPVVRLLTLITNHDVDFMANAINQIDIVIESTGVPQLTVPQLGGYEIKYPTKKEEEIKIGDLINQIDNLITLHQRKLDKIKSLKKAYLYEMFPAEGESRPKRRFKGFTDDWERRKLSDVVDIVMGQSPDGSTYTDTPSNHILVQGNADLKDGWVYPRIWTTQATKKANAGDLIMSVRAPAGEMGKTAYNVVLGRGVAAIKGNEFIFQSLLKMNDDGYWKKLSSGSTFDSLNSDNIKNAELFIPSQPEQDEIGKYFIKIDNLITLHQQKLDKLKNLKKSYLNEMFI